MDPMSIALALGLMLAGTYMKTQAANKIDAERGRLATAERLRQGKLDEERIAAVNQTLPKLGREQQEGTQQSIAQQLREFLTPPSTAEQGNGDYAAKNPGAPQEVKDRAAAQQEQAVTKGRDYASRLSDLSSFNLLNFGSGVALGRLGEKAGNLTSSQINSSNILPYELQAAPRVGRNDLATADVLNGAGTIAAMYGAHGPTTAPAGGAAGGTGITIPQSDGYYGMYPARAGGQGLNIYSSSPSLRAPSMTF